MPHGRACRICFEIVAGFPVVPRSDRPGTKTSAAIRADIVQEVGDAGTAEGAFKRANHRVRGIWRKRRVAVLASRSQFQHGSIFMCVWKTPNPDIHTQVKVGTPRCGVPAPCRRGPGLSPSDQFVALGTKCSAAERGGDGAARHPYLGFVASRGNAHDTSRLRRRKDQGRWDNVSPSKIWVEGGH